VCFDDAKRVYARAIYRHPYVDVSRRIFATAAVLVLTTALSGCAVGPDFHPVAAPAVRGYTPEPLPSRTASADVIGGAPQTLRPGGDIPGQWWTLFHSSQLNRLIEQALKANPSLQAAQAALREADENVGAQEGYLYPSIVGGVSGLRERRLRYVRGDPAGIGSPYTLMNVGVNVSYTLDVFGGIRRQVEAYKAQSEYQRYQLEAAYLTLTANVVTAAVQEASLRGQIAATLELIKDERDQLVIVRNEFQLGGASEADIFAQNTLLTQTEATLPPLKKQLEIERDLLRALTGHFPDQDIGENFDLSTLDLPANLPLSLPSQLVEQRPDVREYEGLLHQASAEIGVATANMLPQFTISGGLGTFAGAGMNPGALAFSVLAGVAQPIFEGGTLLHRRRAAIAAYDQALAEYRYTVLVAFQNVADSLRALQADADFVKAQAAAEHSASESFRVAREQYQAGYIAYPSLLAAEYAYQQTLLALVQAEASRYADTAALFQALGGGWWNRSDVIAANSTDTTPAQTDTATKPSLSQRLEGMLP
jgi:NodT family efflux transporter outer membrane factor (OMF) lipoprotein